MERVEDDERPGGEPVSRGDGRWVRLSRRTLRRAFEDDILAEAAEAAFWTTLSLPPLLLGLLASLGFVGGWIGPEVVAEVQEQILAFCERVFSESVVSQIIAPTVNDILTEGRGHIVSVGFVISLLAGSAAVASYVDAITVAYGQYEVRNPLWQRVVALFVYIAGLVVAVITLPVLALGPDLLTALLPSSWLPAVTEMIDLLYYPIAGLLLTLTVATLYKVALPRKPPWHRGLPGALLAVAVFLVAGVLLRRYITWITSTGFTYGALGTPIAFLLFAFFLGLAIVLGAHLNAGIEELWPPHPTHRERQRRRRERIDRLAGRLRIERGRAALRRVRRSGGGRSTGTGPT